MMYLENYMQLIEDLPNEFRDMLVTIRELDLVVQNAMDKKTNDAKEFFRNARYMKIIKRESVFQSLMQDFGKILDEADEKINVAERVHDMLLKALGRLEREIAKCKVYLETENPGVASAIEDKVAESEILDADVESKMIEKKRERPAKDRKKNSARASTVSSAVEAPTVAPTSQDNSNVPQKLDDNAPVMLNVNATVLPASLLIYDPTPYCICKQVAYGDMIACDNPGCPHEWFHYSCVKLSAAPEGTWYCPGCSDLCKDKKSEPVFHIRLTS